MDSEVKEVTINPLVEDVGLAVGAYDLSLEGGCLTVAPLEILFQSLYEKTWKNTEVGVCFLIDGEGVFMDTRFLQGFELTAIWNSSDIYPSAFVGCRAINLAKIHGDRVDDFILDFSFKPHLSREMAFNNEGAHYGIEIGNITGGAKTDNRCVFANSEERGLIGELIRMAEVEVSRRIAQID
jgi:hypothetical protein